MKWSEAEDRAIREFYPRHGPRWDGWAEVLPWRTERAIASRAPVLGAYYQKPEGPPPKRRRKRRPALDAPTPDPYEQYVIGYMKEGMTPLEIDAVMKWRRGTAKAILVEMWKRDKEENTP